MKRMGKNALFSSKKGTLKKKEKERERERDKERALSATADNSKLLSERKWKSSEFSHSLTHSLTHSHTHTHTHTYLHTHIYTHTTRSAWHGLWRVASRCGHPRLQLDGAACRARAGHEDADQGRLSLLVCLFSVFHDYVCMFDGIDCHLLLIIIIIIITIIIIIIIIIIIVITVTRRQKDKKWKYEYFAIRDNKLITINESGRLTEVEIIFKNLLLLSLLCYFFLHGDIDTLPFFHFSWQIFSWPMSDQADQRLQTGETALKSPPPMQSSCCR